MRCCRTLGVAIWFNRQVWFEEACCVPGIVPKAKLMKHKSRRAVHPLILLLNLSPQVVD
jgi:hypothetical protein